MTKQLFLAALFLAASLSARATLELFNSGSAIGAIPDGNLAGVTFSGTVSDLAGETIDSLTVSLNVSGGYDGNLYAYLVAPNGKTVTLLNQPGTTGTGSSPFGNSTSGMIITLADGGTPITASSALSSGTYQAANALNGFSGVTANGTWNLFFADEVTGGGNSSLSSWSLNMSAVPEPVNVALGIFGFAAVATAGVRGWMAKRKAALPKAD